MRHAKETYRKSEISLRSTIHELEKRAEEREREISQKEALAASQESWFELETLQKKRIEDQNKIQTAVDAISSKFKDLVDSLDVDLRKIRGKYCTFRDEEI